MGSLTVEEIASALVQEMPATEALENVLEQHRVRGDARLITRDGDPYLWRCYLGGRHGPGRAYLHKFVASDEATHHNHPWDVSTSIILAGAYVEHRLTTVRVADPPGVTSFPPRNEFGIIGHERHRVMSRGSINCVYRDTFHWIELVTSEVWTLFIPGERVGGWGFLDDGEYVPHDHWDDWKAGKKAAQ